MINLPGSELMLIKPDGTRVEFDVDKLQSGIIGSCLAARSRDVWIAEDIALSIEYALTLPGNRGRTFTVSDINSIVIRILEEIGYPEVAEEYRRNNSSIGIKINPEYSLIADLISRHLGLHGNNLADVASHVVDSAERLNIAEASPALFVELGKLYKDQLMSDAGAELIKLPELKKPATWQLSRSDIAERLSVSTIELIENKVIDFAGVSQLFPALKLDFRISRLVRLLELESPLTEMAMVLNFHPVAAALNDIITIVDDMRNEKGVASEPMPVYLNINDMSCFACMNLCSSWPAAEPQCRDMISYLKEMINTELFKISFK
jgi:hypothetical protein